METPKCSSKALQSQAVLDYGSGSGVLAICAAHLGASTVVGVDVDEGSVDTCLDQLRTKGVWMHLIFWMFLVGKVLDTRISGFGCVLSTFLGMTHAFNSPAAGIRKKEWGFLNCI